MSSTMTDARFRDIRTNGIRMKIAEMGEGPLVVLAHGWPDSWLSWRHQLRALAAAGFHAVAPQMRGYGESDAPAEVEAYDIEHLAGDLAGIVDAVGSTRAHLVGHDWGSMAAAGAAQFHPDAFASVTFMSVPHMPRPPSPPTSIFAEMFGDDFFYILYHNEPDGIAEAEYDGDPAGLLRRLFASPDAERADPAVTDPKRAAGGWIPRLGQPAGLPDWLAPDEFDEMVALVERSGFRGGVNYYRNMDRNWSLTERFDGTRLPMPVQFVGGDQDMVIVGRSVEDLRAAMETTCADLRAVHLVAGSGHWVQQEDSDAVNEHLLTFLADVEV